MPFNVVDLPRAERAPRDPQAPRVLIYSQDTFGLGHIRRCRAIANALARAEGNISGTARLLGISRPTLYDLMKAYDLQP